METDELNAPLGQIAKTAKFKLPVAMPKLLVGLFSLFGLVIVGWAAFVNDPLGGEPIVVVATKPTGMGMAARSGATGDGMSDGKEHSRHDGIAGQPAVSVVAKIAPPAGSQTVTIIDGSSGKSKEVLIPGNTAGGGKPNDRMGATHDAAMLPRGASKLLQKTRHGFIPKIATDGTRADDAHTTGV